MTGNQIPPGNGSWHPKGFMILTPSHIEVTVGEEFASSVTVWPAGPQHIVSASAPAGSDLRVEVKGHKVTVTGRLGRAGEKHAVQVTVRTGPDIARDTLTIEAADVHRPAAGSAPSATC
ncbi:hypothetical protein [Streptomyces sp. NPDC050548]|uniref:hypothetical protein n=1 Tax=Streptomyces sp. NPDC050548 TaxID=3365629 RepID=UPI00378A682D